MEIMYYREARWQIEEDPVGRGFDETRRDVMMKTEIAGAKIGPSSKSLKMLPLEVRTVERALRCRRYAGLGRAGQSSRSGQASESDDKDDVAGETAGARRSLRRGPARRVSLGVDRFDQMKTRRDDEKRAERANDPYCKRNVTSCEEDNRRRAGVGGRKENGLFLSFWGGGGEAARAWKRRRRRAG
jgi:hypothetical protein